MLVFYKFWKQLLVKRLLIKSKKKKLSILHRLRITQIYVEDFIFLSFKISKCSSYQLQLEAYYVLLHPKLKIKFYTHWNPNWLKKYLSVNLYFLFCSKMLNQLRSLSLKNELQVLSVSEMGKFHTLH